MDGRGMRQQMQAQEDQFSSLAKQMGKWMDHVMGGAYKHFASHDVWKPAINLYEDGLDFHVVADLAGVEPESVSLTVEAGRVLLAGERMPPCPDHNESIRTHLMEIDHGPFQRAIELPQEADPEAITARYRNGLLWIKIPKKQ